MMFRPLLCTLFRLNWAMQRISTNWINALQSGSCKTSFFRFLVQEWAEHTATDILSGHSIYLALEQECYRYTVQDNQTICEEINGLVCTHEEADTRIIYHLYHILQENSTTCISIVIRSYDTNVLILLFYHVSKYKPSRWTWVTAATIPGDTSVYHN